MRFAACLLSVLISLSARLEANAQMTGNRLGDATITPGSSSKLEPYGLNSGNSGSYGAFQTRHTRQGNDGGIGGSFIGTTSVTAETRSAADYVPAQPSRSPAVPHEPIARRLFSESMLYSPALVSPAFNPPSASDESDYGDLKTSSVDSFNIEEIWGHQKPFGHFQPSNTSLRGIDLYSK